MTSRKPAAAILNDLEAVALRNHFIGWQCRVRQLAVRNKGGRPGGGMLPRLEVGSDEDIAAHLVVLIVEREPAETTDHFRHIYRQTQDPRIRYENALKFLSAGYFQHTQQFGDAMTAQFRPDSPTAAALVRLGTCVLNFEEFSQSYRLPCSVEKLEAGDSLYEATRWHNALFNPRLPADAQILAFSPDWHRSLSDPPAA